MCLTAANPSRKSFDRYPAFFMPVIREKGGSHLPCPHYDIRIVQRSENESAVAAAAYQSGEKLFSEYDQEQKYYSHKSEIVHKEIMLPPHAPSEYADRNTLWNAAEAVEKQWNSQLARRVILAIPRELPTEQYADLLRDYCREFFVSKGMCADFAIHNKGDGNPHAHILLTMRAMDEKGKFLPKSRKVYDLDENGERIRLPSGRWKSHKENTVDWNDQKYAEIWRQGWSDTVNRYLEAAGRTERLDLRSYARQGIDKIPHRPHGSCCCLYGEERNPDQHRQPEPGNQRNQPHHAVHPADGAPSETLDC